MLGGTTTSAQRGLTDLRVDGGHHGDVDSEDGLVSVDPLHTGQGHVGADLAVARGRPVRRHAEVELSQLQLAMLEHRDPLEGCVCV